MLHPSPREQALAEAGAVAGKPGRDVGDYNDAVRFNRLVTLFCILLIGIVPQLFVVL